MWSSDQVSDVVILRALGLGDFLTAVPAYRGLRRAFSDASITLAAPAVLEPLAALTGALDGLLPVNGLGELSAMSPPPDLAVNLHGTGPQSIEDLLATGARRLLTHRHSQYPYIAGPDWCEDMHEVERWARLLIMEGIPADPAELGLAKPTQSPGIRQAVIVHPGAKAPARRWPVSRFGTVARALALAGHSVCITGSASERDRCLAVARSAGLGSDWVMAGDLDLGGLAALVADARLVISGDTGIAHLASAYATPSVVLFGPTPPGRWGPPAQAPATVIWRGVTGDPHGRRIDPTLLDVGTDEVLEAAEARLAATNRKVVTNNIGSARNRVVRDHLVREASPSWSGRRVLRLSSQTQAGPVNPAVVTHPGQPAEQRANEARGNHADGHDDASGSERALIQGETREAVHLSKKVEACASQPAGNSNQDRHDHGPEPHTEALLESVESSHPAGHVSAGEIGHEYDGEQYDAADKADRLSLSWRWVGDVDSAAQPERRADAGHEGS